MLGRLPARLAGLLRPGAVARQAARAAATDDLPALADALAGAGGPDPATAQGRTPLMEAARYGREAAAAWLLDRGAAVNRTDALGSTALMSAAREGHLGVMALLRKHGAVTDRVNKLGYSALRWAVKWHQPQAADRLLDWGADVREISPAGLSLADEALLWDAPELLALMLAAGATVTPTGVARAGLKAVLAGDAAALRGVIDQGVSLDQPLAFGLTLVMAAVAARQGALLALLLAAGADPLARDLAGVTALDLALAQGSHDLAAVLAARGQAA